jgi:hypothetical protein
VFANKDDISSPKSTSQTSALPALGHALAGAVGSAISNVCTYPLDLVTTRIQFQRYLGNDQAANNEDDYDNIQGTVRKIYEKEGGISAFYTGLLQDTGKTVADSFLFFLAYSLLRRRRLAAKYPGQAGNALMLPVLDELGIGFLAGSLTKLFTMPINNVVTKKQTSALTSSTSTISSPSPSPSPAESESKSRPPTYPSTAQIMQDIFHERGFLGFWSGYSAVLVLTLNPSLTFLLFETFKRFALPASKRKNPPPAATFLMAALSKACASSVTYPFSVAKVRAQVSTKKVGDEKKTTLPSTEASNASDNRTALSAMLKMIQSEGLSGFYAGLSLELVKSFLSHGTTMIVKQYVHHFIIQAYYFLNILVARLRSKGVKAAKAQRYEYYDLARRRAVDRARRVKGTADRAVGAVTDMGAEVIGKANETADLVADYVEEEVGELKNLYGGVSEIGNKLGAGEK